MKLFCVLISCMFVNILANDDEDYINAVHLTNDSIKFAGASKSAPEDLERAIELMAEGESESTDFAILNYGIAVPDARTCEPIYTLINAQKVVENQVEEITEMTLSNDEKQNMDPSTNDQDQNLEDLAKERRAYTGLALRNIIERDLAEPMQDTLDEDALIRTCRLLGFYASTRFPENYVRRIEIDEDHGTCTHYNTEEEKKVYRRNGRAWVQLTKDDIYNLPDSD